MARALEVAARGWGKTHPNPMVGAVITEGGRIVAEGFHEKDGGPHAEKQALAALGRPPGPGATLTVTLEPCSTPGRTGACTDALIASGIRRVVVGATDPNPAHAGRGFEVLRQAGIEVVTGVREAACNDLNMIFNHWIAKGSPLIAAKTALTLDGRIACRGGHSQWITGTLARADVHRWRRLFPAIAVGAGTVMTDNPRLTARIEGEEEWCPIRFVFDGLLRSVGDRALPAVYSDAFKERTIVVTTRHGGHGYVRKLEERGVTVWVCDSPTQRVGTEEFRRRCAAAGISAVLVEGGARLVSQVVRERALDYLFAYRSPVLLGDDKAKAFLSGLRTETLDNALRLGEVRHQILGDDVLSRGRVVYPEKLTIDEAAFGLG